MEQYYTLKQVLAKLNVDRKVVYEACWRGELQYRKIGRQYRFTDEAITQWLDDQSDKSGG